MWHLLSNAHKIGCFSCSQFIKSVNWVFVYFLQFYLLNMKLLPFVIWKTYPPFHFRNICWSFVTCGHHWLTSWGTYFHRPSSPHFLLLLSVIPTLAYPDSYIFIVLFERFSIHCAWSMCVCAVMFCQQQSPLTSHPVLYVYVSACVYACVCMYVCVCVCVCAPKFCFVFIIFPAPSTLNLHSPLKKIHWCFFFFFLFCFL